jgi:hypothetical protein
MARFKAAPVEIESDLSQDPSSRDELYELAKSYGKADAEEKEAAKVKTQVKGPMLELMTAVVRDEVELLRQVVTVTNDTLAPFDWDYEKWAAREYPEWRVVGILPDAEQAVITLEENETLKKFEFTVDGKRYGRTIAMVGAEFLAKEMWEFLDADEDEGVLIDDDVYHAALDTIKVETHTTYTLDEDKAEAAIAKYPELLWMFQKYSTPGTPQVRLLPIKVAKEEDEV